MARERLQIVNEWFWSKKPKEEPVPKWNIYTLYLYINFYNEAFIKLYKKAGTKYVDIVDKLMAKYGKWKDDDMPGYDKAYKEYEIERKKLNDAFLSSNKPLFDKVKNILKEIVKNANTIERGVAANGWIYNGESDVLTKGQTLINIYSIDIHAITEGDGYLEWGDSNLREELLPLPDSKQISMLKNLLKEVNSVIDPDTNILVPTKNYVDNYNSDKYGDYESGIPSTLIPYMLYGIDDQGMYLSNPDVSKEELIEAINDLLSQLGDTSVSQESLNVSKEWSLFKKKPMLKYKLSFMIWEYLDYKSYDIGPSNLKDIADAIHGEDKDDGAVNMYWNNEDTVYDFLYYENHKDSTWGSDEVDNLLANIDYFYKEGEKVRLKNIKNNINRKVKEYTFELPEKHSKNWFVSRCCDSVDRVIWDIDSVADKVIGDLKDENLSHSHVSTRRTILINKYNLIKREIEQVAGILYDKIVKSPVMQIAQEMTFAESFRSSFVADTGAFEVSVKRKRASKILDEILNNVLSSSRDYYVSVFNEIMDKFYNNLKDSGGYDIYEREINKRSNEIDNKIKELIEVISPKYLEKAKSGYNAIKGNKHKADLDELYDGEYSRTYIATLMSITIQAKYEKEFYFSSNSKLKILEPMLAVYLIRKILKTNPKSAAGKEYVKIVQDVKKFMDSNVILKYCGEANKVVKI